MFAPPIEPIIREIKCKNRLAPRDSKKSNRALHSEKKDGERLTRVILNLGMFSKVVCNRFTEDAYLPRVVCAVFGFAR